LTTQGTTGATVPGVGTSYDNAWRWLWKYFVELLLLVVIYIVISIPSGVGGWFPSSPAGPALGFFTSLYSVFVMGPVGYGLAYAALKAARGEKPEVTDMFEGFKTYLNVVAASLLVSVIVVVGLVLLIVPGIIFACKLAFVPYLVMDRKMEATEAIRTSWSMTDGRAGTIFLIGLLAIPIFIAGALCFGVGVIISAMWVSLAFASYYHLVSASGGAPPAPAAG
jgi:uncharacterized membrane protein